jgi:hypothetical protein
MEDSGLQAINVILDGDKPRLLESFDRVRYHYRLSLPFAVSKVRLQVKPVVQTDTLEFSNQSDNLLFTSYSNSQFRYRTVHWFP